MFCECTTAACSVIRDTRAVSTPSISSNSSLMVARHAPQVIPRTCKTVDTEDDGDGPSLDLIKVASKPQSSITSMSLSVVTKKGSYSIRASSVINRTLLVTTPAVADNASVMVARQAPHVMPSIRNKAFIVRTDFEGDWHSNK